MKVILLENVPQLGEAGQIVEVKRGHARNYLFPRKLAVEADPKNLKRIEHHKKLLENRKTKELREAQRLAQQLEALSLTLSRKAGEQDKLFGAVTDMDIEKALRDKNYPVTRKMIHLDEPIKALGVYQVPIKLHPQVEAKLKVWVIKE